MSGKADSPMTTRKPLSWRASGLLTIWVLLGWAWLFLNIPGRMSGCADDIQQRREYGPTFNMLADAHTAFAREVFKPERLSDLTGMTVADLKPENRCALAWTDEEEIFQVAKWRKKATPAIGWVTLTTGGGAVTGRYNMELQPKICEGGEMHHVECTTVEHLRLQGRERISTGRDEWMSILPGECALGRADGAGPGIVGLYKIELPANRNVMLRAFTLPPTLFVEVQPYLRGVRIPKVQGERSVFRTPEAGTYDLVVVAAPDTDFGAGKGQYSLQVYWGRAVGDRCPIPDFDQRDCYGGTPKETVR